MEDSQAGRFIPLRSQWNEIQGLAMALLRASVVLAFFSCTVFLTALGNNAIAAISTGADGLFHPLSDVTLTIPESGVFNFTGIVVDAGIMVNVAGGAPSISWLAAEDIIVAGTINASGITLNMETPGLLSVLQSGAIHAAGISIATSGIELTGSLSVSGSGSISVFASAPGTGVVWTAPGTFYGPGAVRAGVVYGISNPAAFPIAIGEGGSVSISEPLPVPVPGSGWLLAAALPLLCASLPRSCRLPATAVDRSALRNRPVA